MSRMLCRCAVCGVSPPYLSVLSGHTHAGQFWHVAPLAFAECGGLFRGHYTLDATGVRVLASASTPAATAAASRDALESSMNASLSAEIGVGATSEQGTQLYVSRGTGVWGPPLRLGAPPEVTLVTLRSTRRAHLI